MTRANAEKIRSKNLNELLGAVFTVCLLDKSLSTTALDHAINAARARASRVVAGMNLNRKSTIDHDILGLVIYRWQRLPKYLDEDGRPLALPMRGKGKSIERLFMEVRRANYFREGAKHLLQLRRILRVKNRRFLPNEETTLIHTLTPEVVEYVTHTINRLVATVLYNTSLKGSRPARLIERMASVTDLPKAQVPAFKKFALEQGAVLINTLNDWLESRRDGNNARVLNSANHLKAGVHLFGFLER